MQKNKIIKISNKLVGDNQKTFIIAEVGLSHEGSLGIAKSFIDNISKAGADAVKFQMHYPEYESSKYEKFRKKFSLQDRSRFDYWKRTSFNTIEWHKLKKYSEKKGLIFLCSPFSKKSVEILANLKVEAWKIASGEFNNYLMLKQISKISKKPLILSTGLSTISEIKSVINSNQIKNFSILQCNSDYPTKPKEVGHKIVAKLKKNFNCPVGISDHSGSLNSLKIGVSMNANIIEAHVTFSKSFFGPDTIASITFKELKELINFRDMFYDINKTEFLKNKLSLTQIRNRKLFTKSIVLNKDKKLGSKIYYEDLDARKPLIGIPVYDYKKIINKKLKKDKKKGEFIKFKDLK